MEIVTRLGRTVNVNDDYTIAQDWENFTAEEHARWDRLLTRQGKFLKGLACNEFLNGLEVLELSGGGIPNFDRLSDLLAKRTGWRVVAVPDLVPDDVFFEHLANKRFPAGNFIRSEAQLDYLQEPDVFHDVYGHVPLLANPVFAEYMEAYGKGGLRALGRGVLPNLARLYWYTVEFGLINTPDGMRIYGAGVLSSKSESHFSIHDESPNRIGFGVERTMKTEYHIDDYQKTYMVIDSFESLLEKTYEDFGPIYDRLEEDPTIYRVDAVLKSDKVFHHGTQAYAKAGVHHARPVQ